MNKTKSCILSKYILFCWINSQNNCSYCTLNVHAACESIISSIGTEGLDCGAAFLLTLQCFYICPENAVCVCVCCTRQNQSVCVCVIAKSTRYKNVFFFLATISEVKKSLSKTGQEINVRSDTSTSWRIDRNTTVQMISMAKRLTA